MAKQRKKYGKLQSPVGVAAFSYLKKPDTKFEPVFRITVAFPEAKGDKEFKAFVERWQEATREYAKEIGRDVNSPGIKRMNEKMAELTGHPVGTPYIEAKTKADLDDLRPVPVFNARNEKDPTANVYGGDIVRVELSLVGWESPHGAGVKGYLNAVKLLKSNWTGGAGSAFGEDEEYWDDDDASPEAEVDTSEFEDEGEPQTAAVDTDLDDLL